MTTTHQALLYRPAPRFGILSAFTAAAALHLSAVALASWHRESAPVLPPGFTEVDVEPPNLGPPAVEPDEIKSTVPPDPRQPLDFVEPQEPAHPSRKPPLAPVRSHNITAVRPNQGGLGKPQTLRAPHPEYPYEARSRHITGSGIVTLLVDPATGSVRNASITQSTGNALLDNSALSAFQRWNFVPGTVPIVRIPFTFTLTGVQL